MSRPLPVIESLPCDVDWCRGPARSPLSTARADELAGRGAGAGR